MSRTNVLIVAVALAAGIAIGLVLRAATRNRPTPTPPPTPTHAGQRMDAPASRPATPAPPKRPSPGRLVDLENTTCPTMDGEIGEYGFWLVYNGLLVGFCCEGCDKDFLARPVEMLTSLRAVGVKVPDFALSDEAHPPIVDAGNTICPVRGDPVGESKVYAVHRGVRVALCCASCPEGLAADPDRYLLEAAKSGKVPADRLPETEDKR